MWFYRWDGSRHIGRSYTINSADTWEYKTVLVPAETSNAVANDNSKGIEARFYLAAKSLWTGGTESSSWSSVSDNNRAPSNGNINSSTSNYWRVTGIQLEVGDKATPFEYRSFGEELALCQRYYESVNYGNNNVFISMGLFYQSTLLVSELTWKVLKRADPTITLPPVGSTEVLVNQAVRAVSSVSVSPSKPTSATLNVTTSTSHTVGYPGIYRMDASSYSIDAEL